MISIATSEADVSNRGNGLSLIGREAEDCASSGICAILVKDALLSGITLDADFIENASSVLHDEWLQRNWKWASEEERLPYSRLTEETKEKDRLFVRKAIKKARE